MMLVMITSYILCKCCGKFRLPYCHIC